MLTIGVLPVSASAGRDRPTLMILLPQIALGVLALLFPARPGRAARAAVALVVLPAAGWAATRWFAYRADAGLHQPGYRAFAYDGILTRIGAGVLVVLGVAGLVFLLVRDARLLWAWVLLLLPAGLLTTWWVAEFQDLNPDWSNLVTSAVLVGVVWVAVVALALAFSVRLRRQPAT